ncbi:hypothetical protein Tco_0257167 [Tanacetum coccineum]
MSKSTKPHNSFYNNDFYYLVNLSIREKYVTSLTKHFVGWYHIQGIKDMIPDRWSKKIHHYQIEALNGIHYWEDGRQDFFKAAINNRSPDKVYSDKRIILVVKVVVKKKWGYRFLTSIVVRRSDKKEYECSYVNLPRLSLNDVEDMYLLKLGVESYQRTLNLTKPKFYFKGINQKIPYLMLGTEKGVVYLNQHNIQNLMKLDEVNKFCDGSLLKIHDNLLEMVSKNELGRGNKREQLRRFEEYVGGHPKTYDPHFTVRSYLPTQLPQELSSIHNTFHVSNMKKLLSDESLIILLEEIRVDDKLHFIEEWVEILDREVKRLNQSLMEFQDKA